MLAIILAFTVFWGIHIKEMATISKLLYYGAPGEIETHLSFLQCNILNELSKPVAVLKDLKDPGLFNLRKTMKNGVFLNKIKKNN